MKPRVSYDGDGMYAWTITEMGSGDEADFATVETELPSGRKVRVECYAPDSYMHTEARVNWPSIGACSVEDAVAFAALIANAAQCIAPSLVEVPEFSSKVTP